MDVFTIQEKQRWLAALQRCGQFDWFHLPFCHALAGRRGEGNGHLFVYSEAGYCIALPLLLRPIESSEVSGWLDATSVYGYPGPVASHEAIPEAVVRNFQESLRDALLSLRVVSVFSRMHPLFPQQQRLLAGIGSFRNAGQTVSIDLTLPLDVQWRKIRKDHRRDIRRLEDDSFMCVRSSSGEHIEAFMKIYHETMRRVQAAPCYFFERDYFDALAAGLGDDFHLFMCLRDGKPISGELVTACNGIVQGYLAGTVSQYQRYAPTKLLLNHARVWFSERGMRALHLGGGVGARQDSLFSFKTGFSDLRHDFLTWNWVLERQVYRLLCEERAGMDLSPGEEPATNFFPAYRAPSANPKRVLSATDADSTENRRCLNGWPGVCV